MYQSSKYQDDVRMMEQRQPFELRGLMQAYNIFQTVFSFWMFSQGVSFYTHGSYRYVSLNTHGSYRYVSLKHSW